MPAKNGEEEPTQDPGTASTAEGTSPEQQGPSMEASMCDLAEAFKASSRRWEVVVYPSLIAFIILAIYGFYLIYNLTQDIHTMANDLSTMETRIEAMAKNVDQVAGNMETISTNMKEVSGDMTAVATTMPPQTEVMKSINGHMRRIDSTMNNMAISIDRMRFHAQRLDRNLGKPMSEMNNMVPMW